MPSRIAICLYDEYIDTFDKPELIGGEDLEKLTIHKKTKTDVLLYLKKSNSSTPEWVDIVKGFGDLKDGEACTTSSDAILYDEGGVIQLIFN
jgi:hypothetical protein